MGKFKDFVHKYDKQCLITGVLVAAGVSWYGFDSAYAKVLRCTGTVSKYVTAEYSETTVTATIDANGNPSTSVDTDYWSGPASVKFKVTTTDGELVYQSHDFNVSEVRGVFYPPMPSHDTSMRHDYDFDNFDYHTDTNLLVSTELTIGGEFNQFNDPISKYQHCMDKLGNYIQVKTWFGITYSSDF